MMRTAILLRAALASGVLMLIVSGAGAQEGGGLLPGANGEQKRDGGAVTTCSARNALATRQCSTTCPAGQSADCTDADGSGEPICECSQS